MIVSDSDTVCEPHGRMPTLRLSRRQVLALPAAWLASAACGPSAATGVPVAIASSLRLVWPTLVETTAVEGLSPTFGASRTLARQLIQGAPFELLLAADDRSIAWVSDAGIAQPDTLIEYARGKLVMLTRGGPDAPASVDALVHWLVEDASRRIAIAHPDHAPYGQAAVEVLDTIAQRHALDWRRRAGKPVRGENANQAFQFFLSGAADVALLPASLAGAVWRPVLPEPAAGLTIEAVATDLHAPLRHRAIALRGAGSTALRLLAALRTESVRDVLAEHGLDPPLA